MDNTLVAVNQLMEPPMVEGSELMLTLRPAEMTDCRNVYEWRYGAEAAQFYKSNEVPTYLEHCFWFEQRLNAQNIQLLIGDVGGKPVSHLRLDQVGDGQEISIYVDSKMSGRGIGAKTLKTVIATHLQEAGRFIAYAHRENQVSLRLFQSCGFEPVEDESRFIRLELK